MKKYRFWKVSPYFMMKEARKSKFKTFTFSSLTLSVQRVPNSNIGGCWSRRALQCTHVIGACKSNFFWRKLNDFSVDVRYNRLKLRFLLFSLMSFLSIPRLNGLSKSIALIWKWKTKMHFFESFSSFPNKIHKKEQIQNFY